MNKLTIILIIFSFTDSFSQIPSHIAGKKYNNLGVNIYLEKYEDSLKIKLNSLSSCLEVSYYIEDDDIKQLEDRVKEIASRHYINGIGLILTKGTNGRKGRDGIWFHKITKKYGFKYLSISSSCVVSNLDKIKDAYNIYAYSHLDNRNDNNWRDELENEITIRKQNFIVDLTNEEIKEVRRLVLRNRKWTEYPREVNKLIYIEELSLGYNSLSKIDIGVCSLKNLTYLDLSRNNFSNFPIELFCLLNLRKLSLTHNNIQKIPIEITQLKKLKFLDLRKNQIALLPKEISGLKDLETLFLDDNNFEKVPDCLFDMKQIKTLHIIKGNNITNKQIKRLQEALPNAQIK